ncbi:MAG: hypothetical protein IJV56_03335 [Neisseriaceae bacterium]|nr:hypothetical protein [Neisseriaceae bacterium]
MKIAVLNYSGNVGKTTIARDLLKQNLTDYEIITIDTVNADGQETMLLKGEDDRQIYVELLVQDNVILDIGSSNLEAYLKNSQKHRDLLNIVDKFIIPTTTDKKQQADSLKTVADLINFGVDKNKIFVLVNRVEKEKEDLFSEIIAPYKQVKINIVKTFIPRHELYDIGGLVSTRAADETDYRALMEEERKNGDMEKARDFANMFVLQQTAISMNEKYLQIFNEIFN